MAPLKSCIKLCTFDITNTLLKFRMPVGEEYSKVARFYGVEREPAKITAAFLQNWKIMNSNYPNFGCYKGLTSREWWQKIVQNTLALDGEELTNKQLDCISNHLYEIYKKNICWEVIPGVVPLLKHLKNENISLGVISNFDERLKSVLSANDLDSYFDFILASFVVQVAKPDKKIFDLALHKSSCLLSSNALHIGDDIELDYFAAKNAGWNALLISDKTKKDSLSADVKLEEVIEDIAEVEAHIYS